MPFGWIFGCCFGYVFKTYLNQALDFNFVHVTVKKTLGLLIYNREIVLPHGAGIRSL